MTTEDIVLEAERIIRERGREELGPCELSTLRTPIEDLGEPGFEGVRKLLLDLPEREQVIEVFRYSMLRELSRPRVYFHSGLTRLRPNAFFEVPFPQMRRSRLVFSKKAMAIVASLLLTSLVSLSSLLYGALTTNWLALWSGLCLLALVVYEIVRIDKRE